MPRPQGTLRKSVSQFIRNPRGNELSLQTYLAMGGDPNIEYKGTTLLCEAARGGLMGCVHSLILSSADVNQSDARGCSPLFLAASHGRFPTLEALVKEGADLNKKNHNGYTPLVSAIQNDHEDCAHILIDNGANVNVKRPNTLGVDLSLLSYVLFAKCDNRTADKLLDAGTIPHCSSDFSPPLGFILLEDPDTPIELVRKLLCAGFQLNHKSWMDLILRRGSETLNEKQKELLSLLESEQKSVPSLQRLCRVQIRTQLVTVQNGVHLQQKIKSLPLPVEVQKYVALEYL